MRILGISAFYHDSAACLVDKGEIIAAAQEERFTRKKHDYAFPSNAIEYCLSEAGIVGSQLDFIAFYDKPFLKFERLLETYLTYAPAGIRSFVKAMPLWIKQKLWMKDLIQKQLGFEGPVLFPEHHQSHAASAFFPSPYRQAAFLTIDGVGEWTTTSYGVGKENGVEIIAEISFPHSIGLLYSAFTYYTGFRINSGEYKVMGLAPYGEPKYVKLIYDNLIDLRNDGSFRLNMAYFNYCAGLTMTNDRFHTLFSGPPRKPESELTQRDMDLARSVQEVTEEVMLRMARHIHRETGEANLCLAGGVALNCVANGRILREAPFKNLWIQPAAGDAGGALGAALYVWHQYLKQNRRPTSSVDSQKGSYLGPYFDDATIESYLKTQGAPFERLEPSQIAARVASLLNDGNVVGWFQGRMEFGPRALGSRSILGDARSSDMQKKMNLKIKYRESFRPFAPSVMAEKISDYFNIDVPSPYMLLVGEVVPGRCKTMTESQRRLFGIEKLNVVRSDIPAVTHVDYSARIQTVHKETNPLFHDLLAEMDRRFGCAVAVNTSFNVRGEPIVCTPEDAYRCFMRTEIDYLMIGRCLLDNTQQPVWQESSDWKKLHQLD